MFRASRRRRGDPAEARRGHVHRHARGAGAQPAARERRRVPGAIRSEGWRHPADQVHDGRHLAPGDSERLASS